MSPTGVERRDRRRNDNDFIEWCMTVTFNVMRRHEPELFLRPVLMLSAAPAAHQTIAA